MKILVTGANGFLGRGIVDEIIKTGHTVVAAGFETNKVSSDAIRINGDMFEVADPYEYYLSLIHISEPTRRTPISYAVFCLKKKKHKKGRNLVCRLRRNHKTEV